MRATIKSSGVRALSRVLFLLFLQACVGSPILSETPTTTPTGQVLYTPRVVQEVMPTNDAKNEVTKTVEIAPTVIPTLTNAEMKIRVVELMATNSNCDLPCIWGFYPGKTKNKTINDFFTNLGWSIERFNGTVGSVYYTGTDIDTMASLRFAFYEINGLLGGTSFALSHPDLVERDKWLSLPNIFDVYGKPDQVWVSVNLGGEMGLELIDHAGFDIYLFYQTPRMVIIYHGIAVHEKNTFTICLMPSTNPGSTNNPGIDGVTIYSGSENLAATPKGIMEPFGRFNGKFSFEETSNITIQDLFDNVLSNQEPCFTTPDSIWAMK